MGQKVDVEIAKDNKFGVNGVKTEGLSNTRAELK